MEEEENSTCRSGGFDRWRLCFSHFITIHNRATFNHNFNLQCEVKNILDFENSIEEIENIPNTSVIFLKVISNVKQVNE